MTPREIVEQIGPHSTAADVAPLLDLRETDEAHLLVLLRKRELSSGVIEAVAQHARWNKRRVVRAAIVNHVKTPKTLALRLLSLLFWKEQLKVATNIRLPMSLRVASERRLGERLPELESGEKISMAYSAPTGVLSKLALENDDKIIRALLRNPRLREEEVVAIVRRESTSGFVLRVVALSERWIQRPSVRKAIVSHPNAPIHVALTLLRHVSERELRTMLRESELPRVVALSAEQMLSGDEPSPRSR
jgi:hypothetical protein